MFFSNDPSSQTVTRPMFILRHYAVLDYSTTRYCFDYNTLYYTILYYTILTILLYYYTMLHYNITWDFPILYYIVLYYKSRRKSSQATAKHKKHRKSQAPRPNRMDNTDDLSSKRPRTQQSYHIFSVSTLSLVKQRQIEVCYAMLSERRRVREREGGICR